MWLLAAGLILLGCSPDDPSLVAQMTDGSLTVADVRQTHERIFPDLPFETAPCEQRQKLLRDMVNNELLLGLAREEIDELDYALKRRIRSERERRLIDTYFQRTWGDLGMSAEDRRFLESRLGREAHLLRIVLAEIGTADSCFAAIEAGMSFADAYDRFGFDAGSPQTAMDMGWVTPETLPYKIVRKVFLHDASPGEVVSPTYTTRGVWIVKLLDFRPVEFGTSQRPLIEQTMHVLSYRDTLKARSERLHRSLGLEIHEDNFIIVNQPFNAYWDSVSAESPRANRMDLYALRVPTWRLPPQHHDVPIFEYNDRVVTALEFMQSLEECDVEFWPGGPTREHRRDEINGRIHRWLLQLEAERAGIPDEPEFKAFEERLYEEALLDQFFAERIEPQIVVTPEDVEAQYQANAEEYRIHERAAFTVVLFPSYAREEAVAFREAHQDDSPHDWAKAARNAANHDSLIVFVRDQGVVDLEHPPQNALHLAVFPVVAELERDEVSQPVELPDGRFALVRCTYRRHSEPMPREAGLTLAQGDARRLKTDALVEELLAQERRARRLRMWPERLCAPDTAGREGNQRP